MRIIARACLILIAMLPCGFASAGQIPTNPAKGSQYANTLGSAICVWTSNDLTYTLGFSGVLNRDTVVLSERVTASLTGSQVREETYLYVPIVALDSQVLSTLETKIQPRPPRTLGACWVNYQSHLFIIQLDESGTVAFIDVLEDDLRAGPRTKEQ
jgi:hypothetical protein